TSLSILSFSFFFSRSRHHRYLHSFPTRRSSISLPDSINTADQCVGGAALCIRHDQPEKSNDIFDRHWRRRAHVRGVQEAGRNRRSEEHTSELQSLAYLVCRLLLEKKKKNNKKKT